MRRQDCVMEKVGARAVLGLSALVPGAETWVPEGKVMRREGAVLSLFAARNFLIVGVRDGMARELDVVVAEVGVAVVSMLDDGGA